MRMVLPETAARFTKQCCEGWGVNAWRVTSGDNMKVTLWRRVLPVCINPVGVMLREINLSRDKPGWDARIWLDGFPEQQSGEIPSLPLALLLGNSIPVTHQDQFILLSEDRLCLVSMIYVSHKWYLSHINDICLMYDDYPDTDVQDYASCSGYLCCNVKTSDVPSVIVISRCIWCDICDTRCFKALNV